MIRGTNIQEGTRSQKIYQRKSFRILMMSEKAHLEMMEKDRYQNRRETQDAREDRKEFNRDYKVRNESNYKTNQDVSSKYSKRK